MTRWGQGDVHQVKDTWAAVSQDLFIEEHGQVKDTWAAVSQDLFIEKHGSSAMFLMQFHTNG